MYLTKMCPGLCIVLVVRLQRKPRRRMVDTVGGVCQMFWLNYQARVGERAFPRNKLPTVFAVILS